MNSNATINAIKGQTVCRPSDWFDVARFFVFNYGLHVFTINFVPGSGALDILLNCSLSLVIPVCGVMDACDSILNCARREPDQLRTALKAGGLAMVIPVAHAPKRDMINSNTVFHGQFSATIWRPRTDDESGPSTNHWVLRTVPKSFTVVPPIGAAAVPLNLSCNYSFVAATAGIAQVLSASWELYHASERQIPNLGYAAYSLTVVPYLVMSLVNLVACMCQPQYPTMFLVRYRGLKAPGEDSFNDDMHLLPLNGDGTEDNAETELSAEPELGGTVGDAYGDLSDTNEDSNLFMIYSYSFYLLIAIAPYIVIAALTGFQSAYSTVAQRAWITLWLVSGQVFILIFVVLDVVKKHLTSGIKYGCFGWVAGTIGMCLVATCVMGGFVVVAQMILHDKMCFRV